MIRITNILPNYVLYTNRVSNFDRNLKSSFVLVLWCVVNLQEVPKTKSVRKSIVA